MPEGRWVLALPQDGSDDLPRLLGRLRGILLYGVVTVLCFFVGGGYWAATAPLSGAVVAPGVVAPEGSRRVVQHLEGGIIDEIRVRNGGHVREGDILAVLRSVNAEAEVSALRSRLRALAAEEARLLAERAGSESIDFSHPSLADRSEPEVLRVTDAEHHRLQARRQARSEEREILAQQIVQLDKQIAGNRIEFASLKQQSVYVSEEIGAVQALLDKGLERKPRLLALKRTALELESAQGRLTADIARIEERISEVKLKIINIDTRYDEQVEDRVTAVQAQRSEVEASLRDRQDRLRRTTILSPVSGIAMNLRFKTPGAVAKPGEPIVDIVPSDDELVIEAQVSPRDVDQIAPGQSVSVVFTSFPTRHMLRVSGALTDISADVLEEPRTGHGYYAAKVKVQREEFSRQLPQHELIAGLPVEVYIETGEQTLLEYLAKPFLTTLMRGLREF